MPNSEKMRVHLTSGRYSTPSWQNTPEQERQIEEYEEEINDLLSRSPFLALDRESEWCLFNCNEKLYEHQPWIDRVAGCNPVHKNYKIQLNILDKKLQ